MSFVENFQHLQIPLKDIRLATNNFGNDHCIGRGGFGKVYRGELLLSSRVTMVAIKRLDITLGQGAPEFWKEIMLLSQYKHENLVSLLGFCDENGESVLVYEYLSNESLDKHIKGTNLSWKQRLRICIGAAQGLQYLHDPNGTQQRVLHRDIKSANILLDQNLIAKISDFGLSKIGPANQQYTFLVSNAVGTFGYCDPLYMQTGCLTKESDIYSLGVVFFEVLCGRYCIENHDDIRRFLAKLAQKCYEEKKLDTIIKSSLREQISQECLERFSTIAYQCLQTDRTKRPMIAEIVKELQTALQYQMNWVDKASYGNCFLVFARDLYITWAEDNRYWHWSCIKETSEVSVDVAELLEVYWLEVQGKFDMAKLTPGMKYEVVFIVMLKAPASGWEVPINVRLILPDGKKKEHKENLMEKPRSRWFEIMVGEFMVEAKKGGCVEFSLYEYESLMDCKRGLLVKGAAIRPKI